MNFKNIFKREKKVIIIVVVALTFIVIGSSYALFLKVSNNKNNQTVTAGSLVIEYSNSNPISPGSNENNCLQPQSDDAGKGTGGCEFTFSITNKGSLPSSYNVLISNNVQKVPEGGTILDHKYIKHSLKKNNPSDASSDKNVTISDAKLLSDLSTKEGKQVLESNTINPNETIEFTLHIWIDETAPFDIVNQYIYLNVDVTNTVYEDDDATISLTSALGTSGLNEITSDESNIKEYRFTSKDSKNYVKFNNENWRILGIYNIDGASHLKLVKETGFERAWDANDSVVFTSSTLNTYLNEDYYNGLSDTAKAQISNVTYYLGGPTALTINSKDAYTQEASSDSIKLNVGIMSLSDYAFASGLNDTINKISSTKDSNWLYTENDEWLLTKGSGVYSINSDGSIENNNTTNQAKFIRPTVYLKSNIKLVSGAGTIDSPYELSNN